MSNQSGQRGIIPIPVIVAIAVVSLAAGLFGGYQLGDGTFFSFGVGFGIGIWLFEELSELLLEKLLT